MSRPTKYKKEYPKIAESMCKLGAVDVEIAVALDINISTLYRWSGKHKEFCDALKVGKEPADKRVEMALYHRAIGYSHNEDDIRAVNGEIVITPTTKRYPPDTTAMIFWLKNRRAEQWRANPDGEDSADDVISALKSLAKTKQL